MAAVPAAQPRAGAVKNESVINKKIARLLSNEQRRARKASEG